MSALSVWLPVNELLLTWLGSIISLSGYTIGQHWAKWGCFLPDGNAGFMKATAGVTPVQYLCWETFFCFSHTNFSEVQKRQWVWRKDKLVLNVPAVCVTPSLQLGFHGFGHPLPWHSPQGLGGVSALAPGAPPAPPAETGGCRAVPLTYPHSSLQLPLHWSFPFLILFFTIAQPWLLALAPSDMGETFSSFSLHSHPCSPPTTKTLPCNPHTVFKRILFKIAQQFYW